jgi:K+-sensing histidine kinase KdpD
MLDAPYCIHMLDLEAAYFCPSLVRAKPTTPSTIRVAPKSSGRAIMACLLPGAFSTELLLKTAGLAARDLRADLIAVCISPPRGLFSKPASSLDDELTYASSLGAKTVRLVSRDAAGAILDFAKNAHVSRIYASRTPPPHFCKFFSTSPYCELLRRGEGFRIEIVGLTPHP